jgi:glutamine synthetase
MRDSRTCGFRIIAEGAPRRVETIHVVDHYLSYAHTEQALFDKVVTDWEPIRLFERG